MSKKARADSRIEVAVDIFCKAGIIVEVTRSRVPQTINLLRFGSDCLHVWCCLSSYKKQKSAIA